MEPQKNFLQRNWGWLLVVVILALLVGWGVSKYNNFIVLGQDIDGQWAQVENQFQRRLDLIPNVVATVKGAAKQDLDAIKLVTDARTKYSGAVTPDQKAAAAGEVESALGRLLVIAENYPQLQSEQAYRDLLVTLEGTENRIAVERGKYNDKVKTFDTYVMQFPTNLVAGIFGVKERAYFQAPTGADVPPTVNF